MDRDEARAGLPGVALVMAPPLQYLTSELARALRVAPSMRAAAYLLGMSLGALRKRALKDRDLRPLALACIERGKLVTNPGRRGPELV